MAERQIDFWAEVDLFDAEGHHIKRMDFPWPGLGVELFLDRLPPEARMVRIEWQAHAEGWRPEVGEEVERHG